MAHQTAVEWFAKEINNMNVSREATLFINKLKEQAKQMEKEQIEKAYQQGALDGYEPNYGSGEKYYNDTFGKQ